MNVNKSVEKTKTKTNNELMPLSAQPNPDIYYSCVPQTSVVVQKLLKTHINVALVNIFLHYDEHGRCSLFYFDPTYTVLLSQIM